MSVRLCLIWKWLAFRFFSGETGAQLFSNHAMSLYFQTWYPFDTFQYDHMTLCDLRKLGFQFFSRKMASNFSQISVIWSYCTIYFIYNFAWVTYNSKSLDSWGFELDTHCAIQQKVNIEYLTLWPSNMKIFEKYWRPILLQEIRISIF